MKRIVVPTDFSSSSERAFAPAAELARRLGEGLVLLHVVREPSMLVGASPGTGSPIPQPDVRNEKAEAEANLRALRSRFADLDLELEVRVGSNPAQVIADFAREIDASAIAIATHGRAGLRRLVLGSVTENVLRRAKCPVICYPGG